MRKRIKLIISEKQMTIAYTLLLMLLFCALIRLPVVMDYLVTPCLLLFDLYLLISYKNLRFDVKFVLVFLTMILYAVLYNYLIAELDIKRFINIVVLQPLFYLLGKQLTYYPDEGKASKKKIEVIIGTLLLGCLVLSLLEIYAYYISKQFEYRIWLDFWRREDMYATLYSFFAVIWVSLLFYGLWILKKKPLKGCVLLIGIFLINGLNIFAYNRMHLGVMILVFVFSVLLYCFQNRKNYVLLLRIGIGVICLGAVFFIILRFNVWGISEIPYVQRFMTLATSQRMVLYRAVILQMPKHLWGGGKMDLLGLGHTHNQWLQMYHETGIIPFLLLCAFTVLHFVDCIKIARSKTIEAEVKYMILPICFGMFLYFTFEAVAHGKPDFFVYYMFIMGMCAQIVESDTLIKQKGL